MTKISKKTALTLVEVLIAISIFTIAFAGILVMNTSAKKVAENSMINFCAIHYGQSLLELIQAYPYHDPSYPPNGIDPDVPSDCASVFNLHNDTLIAFDTTKSGIYSDPTDPNSLTRTLTEKQLGLRYFPTTLPASPSPKNPFDRTAETSPQKNLNLIGPEHDDTLTGTSHTDGIYMISQDQYDKNIFGYSSATYSNKDEMAKYFFMDDVDDFDGYKETREILPGIYATYEVSVMGVYTNTDNYPVEYENTTLTTVTDTITQKKYDITQNIIHDATNNTILGIDFSSANQPVDEAQKHAIGYYNNILFKKVTIKMTWEYPPGSNIKRIEIINGGKPNPDGLA